MPDEPKLMPRYTLPAIVAHWAIAVLIILNIAIGLLAEQLPEAQIRFAIDTHKSIGVTILGLVLLRILWRLSHRPPPFSAGMAAWERVLAHVAHFGLYALMLWMPITGWLHDSAWKAAPEIPMRWFGLFEWPRIGLVMAQPEQQKEYLHGLFGAMHAVGGYALIAVLLIHVAGALKHQFVDGEPQFRRMWPGRDRGRLQ